MPSIRVIIQPFVMHTEGTEGEAGEDGSLRGDHVKRVDVVVDDFILYLQLLRLDPCIEELAIRGNHPLCRRAAAAALESASQPRADENEPRNCLTQVSR